MHKNYIAQRDKHAQRHFCMKKILHRGSLLHESKKKTEYKKKKTNQGTGVTVIVKLNNKKKTVLTESKG